jgi:hypothetical protein
VQYRASKVTIVGAEDVIINSLDNKFTTLGQYASITLKKMAANEWFIGGALE